MSERGGCMMDGKGLVYDGIGREVRGVVARDS